MATITSRRLASAAGLLAILLSAVPAEAGGPFRSGPAYAYRPTAKYAGPPVTNLPYPTAYEVSTSSRYLGTFRPDPTLMVRTGTQTGGGYEPGGLPSTYAAMSVYGPFSRLRAMPEEVTLYSRGYDGRLVPTSTGITYRYPDPNLYPDTVLTPTSYRYVPGRGVTPRSRFAPYLLGQY